MMPLDLAIRKFMMLCCRSGNILHTTTAFQGSALDAILKSRHIVCYAVDAHHEHLVTAGDDKKLKVWRIDGLELISER
jgi:tRNA (guanine-N(7)-)-methyltransferase subunit TRM82